MAEIQKLIEENYRITFDVRATEVGISHGSVFSILTEHRGLGKLSARWVPKALLKDQLPQ